MADMPIILQILYKTVTRGAVITKGMVISMSPKELIYIEDALNHEQFIKTQITESTNKLTDTELKSFVSSLTKCHNDIYKNIYQTL